MNKFIYCVTIEKHVHEDLDYFKLRKYHHLELTSTWKKACSGSKKVAWWINLDELIHSLVPHDLIEL